MVKKKVIIITVIVVLIVIAGFYINYKFNKNNVDDGKISVNNETYCNNDLDCVPASCCHPNSSVNINYKPSCAGIICSQECSPGSLDCGQATCGCINNKCSVVNK